MARRLEEYRARRRLERSGEPGATVGSRRDGKRFVIQQHAARTMHWDLRLEAGGVLMSWAVPKGPSTDPREKRLALRTEDHPLGYADFEGVIPEGEYGAGAVIVWDRGTYRNRTVDDDGVPIPAAEAIARGHLVFRLAGEKLAGGWALTRFDEGEDDGEEKWLLVKVDDEGADARRRPVSTQPESVVSGLTVEQVAADGGGDDQ